MGSELFKLGILWRLLTYVSALTRLVGEAKVESAVTALDSVKQAVIACDRHGTVVRANEEAARLVRPLERGQRITFRHAQSAALLTTLLDAVSGGAPTPANFEQSVSVLGDNGKRLEIRAVALGDKAGNRRAGDPVLLLLKGAPPSREELLLGRFRLTSAEMMIALSLLDGYAVDEIATARGITQNTVRAQLNSIYMKTNTRSQAHFVSLAARIIYSSI